MPTPNKYPRERREGAVRMVPVIGTRSAIRRVAETLGSTSTRLPTACARIQPSGTPDLEPLLVRRFGVRVPAPEQDRSWGGFGPLPGEGSSSSAW